MVNRELTRSERSEIKRLVPKCANFDHEYGCLLLDCDCIMSNKYYTGSYCRYFKDAILPLNPVLEALLIDKSKFLDLSKTCPVCGNLFKAFGRKLYCSEVCRITGTRNMERKKKRRQRANRG